MSDGTVTTIREYQGISPELKDYFTGFGEPGAPGSSLGLLGQAQKYYAQPYEEFFKGYQPERRVAGLGLAPGQEGQAGQAFYSGIMGLAEPGAFNQALGYAGDAARAFQGVSGYTPSMVSPMGLNQYQMGPAQQVSATGIGALPGIQAAQTGYQPALTTFQMEGPQSFGAEQAQQYMSPYAQAVTDVEKRKAMEDAQRTQLQANLAAGRKGSLGASGQLLATTERERNLGTQLGDIQARGLQEAYTSAQGQFERDRAARQRVQEQNLAAQLGVQQLGTQTGLQTALANLSADQQARVQNAANQLQARGMDQESALRAALANQQAGLTVGTQNLAALLDVQKLGAGQSLEAQRANQLAGLEAASKRLGAAQGLAGLTSATGQLGLGQQAAALDRLRALGGFADLERGLEQQRRDVEYQDMLRRAQFGEQQLMGMSSLLRGTPMGDRLGTSTAIGPAPSFLSQIGGAGLSAASLYNLMGK